MAGSSGGRRPLLVTIRPSTLYDWVSHRLARSDSRLSRWSSSRTLAWLRSKYRAVPNASTVIARATVYQTVSLHRMVVISCFDHVPDAADGMHQLLGVARVDLLA